MLDDNSALFWGFVFIEFISFIFIKFWGKKIIPTFISGFLFWFYFFISDKKNYIFDGISYSFFEIENSHGCDPGSLGTGGGPVDPRKGTSSGGPTGGGRK